MIHINIRKSVSALLFGVAASMLSCYGDHWKEADPVCNDINNELFGERHIRVDVDQLDNAFTKSYIEKTKETTLSVNGKAFWISSKANPGEPKDIAYFSSKGIKNWELGLSPDKTEFVMKNVEGTLWAVSKAGDLYTFVNGTDGTYQFQKDPSIKDVRYVYSGFDGDVWILAEKPGSKPSGLQIYHLDNGTWKLNPGKSMICLAVTDKNTVYALSTQRKVYKWDETKNTWAYITMAIGAKDIRSGPTGDLWQVSLIGITFIWTGKKWEPMGGTFVDNIAVGKVRTYAIFSYKLGRTPHKFAFDLLAIGDLQKVHVRPSQIVNAKAEKAAQKKAGTEKAPEANPEPVVPVESK